MHYIEEMEEIIQNIHSTLCEKANELYNNSESEKVLLNNEIFDCIEDLLSEAEAKLDHLRDQLEDHLTDHDEELFGSESDDLEAVEEDFNQLAKRLRGLSSNNSVQDLLDLLDC